jgi:hypothetical protein
MPFLYFPFLGNSNSLLLIYNINKIIQDNNMKLELQDILVTGRTLDEYIAFFGLDLKDLVWQKSS